jgi:hypothetical protein
LGDTTSDIIFDEVVKRFDKELERANHLDDKASNTVGFIGILTGIVPGFGAFTLKLPTTQAEFVVTSLFGASLFALFFALVFGLKAYSPQKFTLVPDQYYLIGKYDKMEKEKVVGDLCDNYAIAIEDNGLINDTKVKNIKRTMNCLFVAIVLFALFAIGQSLSG